jgi:integrase
MIPVFLVKRYKRNRQRNGKREYRWALRWEGPGGWRCEGTGTADRTQAEALQKQKWAELNVPGCEPEEPAAEPAPEPVKATWDECKEAVRRAMEADNLRPSYIYDASLALDGLRAMFPEAETPNAISPEMANEWKRRRAETKVSPWSIKGDLATLKAVFGKWLGRELDLLASNPFAKVKPPKCDDPEVRIITAEENAAFRQWFSERWNNWRLPLVYLDVLGLLGWRATETASLREADLLADGFVRVTAVTSKTRRHKFGWLPPARYADLTACSAAGWAFGRFPDELRRLLILWLKRPNHAAQVKDFTPKRLVCWLQDEVKRFHEGREGDNFTLHDFRRTAITSLQMAGVSEKETSLMVGATPEVIRKHYEKLDAMAIAKRNTQKRLAMIEMANPNAPIPARRLRAEGDLALDSRKELPETETA